MRSATTRLPSFGRPSTMNGPQAWPSKHSAALGAASRHAPLPHSQARPQMMDYGGVPPSMRLTMTRLPSSSRSSARTGWDLSCIMVSAASRALTSCSAFLAQCRRPSVNGPCRCGSRVTVGRAEVAAGWPTWAACTGTRGADWLAASQPDRSSNLTTEVHCRSSKRISNGCLHSDKRERPLQLSRAASCATPAQ